MQSGSKAKWSAVPALVLNLLVLAGCVAGMLVPLRALDGSVVFAQADAQPKQPEQPKEKKDTKQPDQGKVKNPKETKQPSGAGAGGNLSGGADGAAKPEVKSISPETISTSPSVQEITLTLSGVKDGDELTSDFTGPKGGSPVEVKSKASGSMVKASLVLNDAGKWAVTIKKGSDSSAPREFEVKEAAKGTCHPQNDSAEVKAFQKIFRVMNHVLLSLFIALALGLLVAMFKGWSVGDALAEESSEQPAVIKDRSSVVMVASASRIVAVVGLFGILALIIGIGYSIVWNLTVCGTAPELSGIKGFLVAIVALFTPYLANQIREAVSPSNPPKTETPTATSSVTVTDVSPKPLIAGFAARQLDIIGSGFQDGLRVNLIDPAGTVQTIPAADTTVGAASHLHLRNIVLNRSGAWKAVVISSSGDTSDAFVFAVTAPMPTLNPVPAIGAGAAVVVNLTGQNFLPSTTVTLQSAAGQNIPATPVVQDGQNISVTATFQAGSNGTVTVKNGDNAAATQPFTVT